MTAAAEGDLTVVVADDHPPTRLAITLALEGNGFHVAAEAATADEAVAHARRLAPDLCLVDVNMPGNGINAARQIVREVPGTAVVMLTVSSDDMDLFDAIRAGARGYLLKDVDPDRLPLALRGVLDGEAALPRGLVMRLLAEFRDRDERRVTRGRGARLTGREWEVLDLLAKGRSTAEIAEQLFVGAVTVRTHVAGILRKLHAPDRATAVRLFRESR